MKVSSASTIPDRHGGLSRLSADRNRCLHQIAEPAMGLVNGVDEDDTRAMRHGARDAHFLVRALDDLAPAMGR